MWCHSRPPFPTTAAPPAPGAVSQLVTVTFSRMAMDDHAALLKHEAVAQALSDHIAHMDLEPAKQTQLEALDRGSLSGACHCLRGGVTLP